MRFKRFLVALATGLLFIPAASSALTLSPAGQLQLAQLASQLLYVFNQIAQAQAQGTAYTSSPAFQTQAVVWTSQLVQIQQQLSVLIASAVPSTPTTIPTQGGATASCPSLLRDLDEGAQGGDVASLQLFLARDAYARYTGGVSGYFDSATVQALQRYQVGYGIISYGAPSTTGYGRVGPGTRASIAAVCAHGSYVTSVPPITVPVTQTPTYQPPITQPPVTVPTTVQTSYSTGQLSVIQSSIGQSGGPTSATFSVNMLPNSTCTSAAFTLAFGDGQTQTISSNASCGNQVIQVPHVYANTGSYTATLSSGSFQTQATVTIQAANNSVTLSVATDSNVSYGSKVTASYNPGVTCVVPATYTISFGDGSSQSLTFNSGCSTQVQTINHTYSQSSQYLITASDNAGHTVTTTFTPVAIISAGAGDPFQVLWLRGEGSNNSSNFVDSSPKAHEFDDAGNARIETAGPKVGNGSMRFDGSSYISTPSSTDFNFGTGSFTMSMWVKARAFPGGTGQAAVVMQAGATAADSSLGGLGLEFFGDKIYFVGNIGNVTYHPFYNNTVHTNSLLLDTWYHLAVVRSGGVITMYLNGTSVGTMIVSGSANASSAAFTLGRYGEYNGNYFNGNIDELDIAKGIARWTSTFTPEGYVAPAPASVTGLKGNYYDGINFNTYKGTYTDTTVDFNPSQVVLGTNRSGGSTSFSARWTGYVKADYTDTYTFYTVSDDGARFMISSSTIINVWSDHGEQENSATINLQAGQWYPIVLEYYNNAGNGLIRLMYSSPHVGKTIIPSTNLVTNP